MWIRGGILQSMLLDRGGAPAGRVVDTYPSDGSSPEFAVVRLARSAEKVLVSLDSVSPVGDGLQVPYSRVEIEDAPSTDCARYQYECLSIARAYWSMQGDARVAARGPFA